MILESKIIKNINEIERKTRRLNAVIHSIKKQTELVESLESELQSEKIKIDDKLGVKLTDEYSFFTSNFTITVDILISLLKDNIEENTAIANELVDELGIEGK